MLDPNSPLDDLVALGSITATAAQFLDAAGLHIHAQRVGGQSQACPTRHTRVATAIRRRHPARDGGSRVAIAAWVTMLAPLGCVACLTKDAGRPSWCTRPSLPQ